MTDVLCVLATGEQRNPVGSVAPMSMVIAVGFGMAVVTCNGEVVLGGNDREDVTVADAESKAVEWGYGRWRIHMDSPLWSAEWERQGPGKWVCVKAGRGFA